MGPGMLGKPDWIMVGMKIDRGKYRLYASRTLPRAEFEAQWTTADGATWGLTASLTQMLIIDRDSYGECLAYLMTVWGNQVSGERGLPPGQPDSNGWRYMGSDADGATHMYARPLEPPPHVHPESTPSGQHAVYRDDAGRMLTPEEAADICPACGLRMGGKPDGHRCLDWRDAHPLARDYPKPLTGAEQQRWREARDGLCPA